MFFGVSKEYVVKRDRKRERIQIRQMSMYACCIFTNNSLKEVGQHFGGYDHTTIIHAKNTINDLCDTDEDIKDTFANLKDFIIKSKEKFAK